jgi:hypothetical protein
MLAAPIALMLTAASRSADVAPAKPVAVLPFVLYDGRVFLPVRVDGRGPGQFQFDSAANSSCVSKRFGERIRLKTGSIGTVSGAGDGSQTVALADDVSFAIGPLAYRSPRVALLDLDGLDQAMGRSSDGIIGRDFLERYVVAIDHAARTLTAYEPCGFEYRGTGAVIPIEVVMGGPVIDVVLRMPDRPPLAARILLDAPHAGPVVLTTPFVDRHNLLDSARLLTPTLLESTLMGVGGESAQLVGRALSLEIGPFEFRSPVVFFSRAKAGALAATAMDGLIGSQILGRFRVVYDHPRRRVILEPGPRLAEPFAYDMTGLRLRARTRELPAIEIVLVRAAGVQKGDLLVSINERPARAVELPEIRALFERPGEVRLRVKRGSREKTFVLELRPRV